MNPHEREEGWLDLGLIAGVLIGAGFVLVLVEIWRLPARIWRAIK